MTTYDLLATYAYDAMETALFPGKTVGSCVYDAAACSFSSEHNTTVTVINPDPARVKSWPSRDPMSEIEFLKRHIDGMSRKEQRRWIVASRAPVYLFAGNDPVSHLDFLGLASFTWQQCYDAYAGSSSITQAEKDAILECISDCSGKSGMQLITCLLGCTTGRAVAYLARIACCATGAGSATTANPCAGYNAGGDIYLCHDCCEAKVCANAILEGINLITPDKRVAICICRDCETSSR